VAFSAETARSHLLAYPRFLAFFVARAAAAPDAADFVRRRALAADAFFTFARAADSSRAALFARLPRIGASLASSSV
jgi:hypothetical protein